MPPSDRDFDLLADRLANGLSTDEQQLDDLGPAVFTTAKLIEMKGRYRERLSQFDFWQGRLMKAAMWSPVFVPLGGFLLWAGIVRAGWVLVTMFPVVLMVALAGIFLMVQQFGGRQSIEARLVAVEAELRARQKEAEAKKRKI